MSWFLYVLECSDGSLYTGITINVETRFAAHLSGKGAKYTRARPPVRVLAVQEFSDRSTALKAEYALKRLPLPLKREFCAQHPPKEKSP